MIKRLIKRIFSLVLILILIVGAYVAYVFVSYHRIEDNLNLEINNPAGISSELPVGESMKAVSWNIGFGAYVQDYTFFMDGGEESRARSEEELKRNIETIIEKLESFDANLMLLQEVDFDATRTYHVDEPTMIRDGFEDYANTFAQNYDSPYLFYPITSPHGANKSGLLTMTDSEMSSSIRRSLPIQTDFAKILDLDRCIDVIQLPTSNGKILLLINMHLSAYTTDPSIADSQLEFIYDIASKEYAKGNYVICGGDFNKDLLGDQGERFGVRGDFSWCKPFKEELIPEGFKLVKPYKGETNLASNRNNDEPYNPETTFTCTLDGFLVSDNVIVEDSDVIDMEFMYSDHNPVYLNFKLQSK